jgi:RNA polymerase sigma-70 factor (ECF subfamily)
VIDAGACGVWGELTARLRPFVARRVAPADVDDVVQDIFLRIQTNLGALRDSERFGPWVYQVARSAIADHRRVRARHPVASTTEPEEAVDASATGPEDDAAAEVCRCIAPFVARLPSPYREAITLTELEGLSQKAAAEMAGVSLSGMKSRVQRGRERLREMLLACCEIALDPRGHVIGCTPKRPGAPSGGCGSRT